MHKLINIFDLTRLYERYNSLTTDESKKQFTRIVCTLSLCAVTIIFIWYCGIDRLNIKNQSLLPPIEQQSQGKQTPLSGDNKLVENIKHDVNSTQQNKTGQKNSDMQQVKDIKDRSTEVLKTSVSETSVLNTPVNQAK
ncbi:MAG: hypothetical protein ACYDG2_21080, partial [Ruminiclostridium sp.]